MHSIFEALSQACARVGLREPKKWKTGTWIRCDVIEAGRRGRGDGAVFIFPDEQGVIAHNWITSERVTVFVKEGSREESPERIAQREAAMRQARLEQERRAQQAARIALEILEAASQASGHPYFDRKGLPMPGSVRLIEVETFARIAGYAPRAKGEPMSGMLAVAAVRDASGSLSTLEIIDEHGNKAALAGGTRKGRFWSPDDRWRTAKTVILAEGIATAASISLALDDRDTAVVATLSAGNIEPVGRAILEARGDDAPRLIIAADLDEEGHPFPLAVEAAKTLNADLLCPVAPPGTPLRGFDFDDMRQKSGIESVKERLIQRKPGMKNPKTRIDVLYCYENPPVPRVPVLPGFLPGTVGSIVSPGGSGKSMIALQMAHCIAGETNLLGIGTPAGGQVVYLSAEDGRDILHERLHAIGQTIPPATRELVAERLIIEDLTGYQPDLLDAHWCQAIERLMEDKRLIILDPLRSFHLGDENDSKAMNILITTLRAMAARTGCAAMFLHHSNKGLAVQGQGDLQQAARGSSALTDGVRWQSYLVGMTRNESNVLSLRPGGPPIGEEDRRRYVRFGVSKQNYGPPLPEQWYRRGPGGVLEPVTLCKTRKKDDD